MAAFVKCLITVVLCICSKSLAVTRFVDPENGDDLPQCLISSFIPCRSLHYALNHSSTPDGTHVFLQGHAISLTSVIQLHHHTDISIHGNCSPMTIINCSEVWTSANENGAGFSFVGTNNLQLQCFKMLNCGAAEMYENGSLDNHLPFRSAVYLKGNTNISINRVWISHSNGMGITMFDVSGSIFISNSHFSHNKAKKPPNGVPQTYFGGGGINMNISNERASFSQYHFLNCVFHSNKKYHNHAAKASAYPGLTTGAGISLRIQGNITRTCTRIENCTFTNNSASWGGGMIIDTLYSAHGNNVSISNSKFISNEATSRCGGGVDIGFYLFSNQYPAQGNRIYFYNCTFQNNTALYGGGTTLFSDLPNVNMVHNNSVTFNNCSWLGNLAKYSAAVDVSPNVYANVLGGFKLTIMFTNCSFISNYVNPVLDLKKSQAKIAFGSGTFLITGIDVVFKQTTKFIGNNGTALQVVSASAIFENYSEVVFANNSGFKGGALALIGMAYLQFDEHSMFSFENNRAQLVGGAVYTYSIDLHEFLSSRTCFFRYKGGNKHHPRATHTKFFFTNNSARSHIGDSIFASTLKTCKTYNKNCPNNIPPEKMLDCAIASFVFDNSPSQSHIATIGQNFKTEMGSVISIVPGQEISIKPEVEDEFQNLVTNITVFHSYLTNLDQSTCNNVQIMRKYEYSPTGIVQVRSPPGQVCTLTIQTDDVLGISKNLVMKVVPCPPGFYFDNVTNQCSCAISKYKMYNGFAKCNSTSMRASIKAGYWAGFYWERNDGPIDPSDLYVSYCPPGYCVYSSSDESDELNTSSAGEHLLPEFSSQSSLDKFMCGSDRTGQLCGDCQINHSVGYHSRNYKCVHDTETCKYGILLYALSDLFPLTVLFVAVLVFDISFTSGSINGFIFFAQVVDLMSFKTSNSVSVFKPLEVLVYTYQIIYGFFSMEFFSNNLFGHPFCLWKGANALDVLVIKYATIVYAVVLVLVMVLIMDYCNCHRVYKCLRNRNISTSFVQGLSAFLIMCYSQCVRVTFQILRFVPCQSLNHTINVVYIKGSFTYFGAMHLPYAIPALFFLFVLVIPLPLFLFSAPLFMELAAKYSEKVWIRKLYFEVNRQCLIPLKPLLDSFQGCYKNNCRYFAGLYLLYRVAIVAALTFSNNESEYYAACALLISVVLALHCIIRPYQAELHNLIDAMIFINLGLVNYTSLYSFMLTSLEWDEMKVGIQWAQVFLIYLPLLYFTFRATHVILSKFKNPKPTVASSEYQDWPTRLLLEESRSDESRSGENTD